MTGNVPPIQNFRRRTEISERMRKALNNYIQATMVGPIIDYNAIEERIMKHEIESEIDTWPLR